MVQACAILLLLILERRLAYLDNAALMVVRMMIHTLIRSAVWRHWITF